MSSFCHLQKAVCIQCLTVDMCVDILNDVYMYMDCLCSLLYNYAENQNFEIVTSSPLVIPAGDMSVTVVINILNDTIFDGNKTFALRLLTLTAQDDVDMSPVLGSSVVTMVTIIEDDTSKFDI